MQAPEILVGQVLALFICAGVDNELFHRITKIVEAIFTVSIQTNTLAVNGPIEAARAGEFGKGFVVLSTDTRPFVAFTAGGESFAVAMAPVQEIIRVPAVLRVPLAQGSGRDLLA